MVRVFAFIILGLGLAGLWFALSGPDLRSAGGVDRERTRLPVIALPALNNEKAKQSAGVASLTANTDASLVLVNVFASWCTPCIAELPYLQQLRAAHNIRIIGIAWNDDAHTLTPWLAEHGNPFHTVYLDSGGRYTGLLNLSGLPESFLINKDRDILYRHTGPLTPMDLPRLGRLIAENSP